MFATVSRGSDYDAMMEGVTLARHYNYEQRQPYSNGRSNVDQAGSFFQHQEDSIEDINDIELGRTFDLNAIERRLGDCFGNMRKNFEGDYMREKRGPKFGNYGSFLPTQERSPQRHQQTYSYVSEHNYNSQKTINEGAVEKGPGLVVTDVSWRIGSIGYRNLSLHDCTSREFTKETLAVNGAKIDEISPEIKKPVNGIRLRFKLGPDTISCPKNSAINTGLGLQNSSSTLLKDSPDKGQMASSEVESYLDLSPLSIIQIMTSYQVPGGSLLSPLQNKLKEGKGKGNFSSKDIKERTGKVQVMEDHSANSIAFEYGNGIQAPMPKKDMTTGIFESKKEPLSQLAGDKIKKVRKDARTKCRVSKASDVMDSKGSSKFSKKELYKGESDIGVACNLEANIHRGSNLVSEEPIILSNGKDIRACLSKDENFEAEAVRHPGRSSKTEKGSTPSCMNEIHKNQEEEHTKEPRKKNGQNNVSVVREMNKSLKEVNTIGLSEAIAYQEKNMLNDKCNGVPKAKVLGQVATHKKALVNTEHVKDMENEKTHDINMLKKTMKEESKEVVKYNFKESVNEKPRGIKGQKGPAKTNSKDLCATRTKYKTELVDIKKETTMAPCNESTKPATHKQFDRELSRGIEREKKRDVADEHNSKKLARASNIKAHVSKEADTRSLPEQFTTKDPVAGSSLGFDDWVCCDACEKWRLCPIGLKLSPLPKKWLCHMMFWLPGMNRCDVPQEETTQAVYNLCTIMQTQVHSETNQGNVQLPATISAALPDPKRSDQIQTRSLQSSTKFGNNKKGLVQRSMPNVSSTVTFLNSFAEKDEHSPVKNKSGLYVGHMEQEDGNTVFSQCEDEGKSNGLIEQLNIIKQKGKLKQISGGQANDIELGNVHTLNVKRKRDSESKECTPLKKMKAKQELVHDAEGVDLLLRSERTDHGFKFLKNGKLTKEKNEKLTKENGVEILNKESKFKDQQQATKKRKLKEWKEGKTTHQGLLETNCMVDSAGEEERQPGPKRVKKLKTESSQSLVSKGIKGGKEQIVKSVSSKLKHTLHEMEDHGMQQFDEHGLMQKASDHTEPLKNESSCQPPFVSTTSSSSKFSLYAKSLGTVPDGRGSPVESSVSSSPTRNLKAVELSLARFKDLGKDDFMDSRNMMLSSPRKGLIGDVRSDHSGLIRRTKDLHKAPGTNEKYRIDKSTCNTCRDMNSSGGRDDQQLASIKPKDENFNKLLTSNGSFRVQERGNEKAKHDLGVQLQILDYESTESKQYEGPFIRKIKAGEFSSKDRRITSHYSPEQERALNYSFAERNVVVETDSIKDKTKISPHSASRSEGRGDDSRPDILFYKGNQLEGSLIDASSGESSRGPRESGTCCKGTSWSHLKSPAWNGFVGRDIERVLASPKREIWSSTANAALQEGRDLKQKADGLKNNGGDELGFIGFYFRASLKFLQSASILEPLNARSARQGENKSMALFTYSARLSENCAKTYERYGKWAAATLAYQCTGVAHMHVIMANTASISRDRRELQSAALLIPNVESPRSSASDVDNLNCLALTVKDSYVNREKGVTSLHASGNYVINTQNCQQYNRVLQFVDDTNAAFEAFAKANFAFAAINDSSYKEQEISAVKRAIDLNFHNVDGLLRLVLPVMESIDL